MAKKYTRLYVSSPLSLGATITLSADQSHYLITVLRMKDGEGLQVFNETDGNWSAHLQITKKQAHIMVHTKDAAPSPLPPLHFYFPAIKKHRLSWLIEKATELGATAFHPIITERTHQPLPSLSKLQAIAIEAAEQSERIEIPAFHPTVSLKDALAAFPKDHNIYVGREQRDRASLIDVWRAHRAPSSHIMIGPEGGFSDAEFALMEGYPFVRFMTLSAQVLRTETAALAALAMIQMLHLTNTEF
ncbi:MAG: RsmE family RNA methyltransferase [Candidatus Nucleicultricaceae bacterium]